MIAAGQDTIAAALLLPSYLIAAFGAGYVARKRGRTRAWALAGLLNWAGVALLLLLPNRAPSHGDL